MAHGSGRPSRLAVFAFASVVLGALAARSAAQGGHEALIKTAAKGDLAGVQALLKQGVDPNAADGKGYTALMEAARMGKVEVVEALIKAGADVNAHSKDGTTAALRAVLAAQAGTLKVLAAAGADMKATNAKGETPLRFAVQNASANVRPEIITVLAKAGVNVKSEQIKGEPALLYAISSLQEQTVAALLNAGADPNAKDSKGRPAIVRAAERSHMAEHVKMVAALIAAGVDVNARDERGRSALEAAVDVSSVDYKDLSARKNAGTAVYMLTSRGADSASVDAARDFVIKKMYVLFDTMIHDGTRDAAKRASAARSGGPAPASARANAPSASAAAPSAPAGKPKPLDTSRFSTQLPSDWEVAANDLESMGMLTVQRKGSGGAEGVYFKFEGPNWDGTPEKAIAEFAKSQKGSPPAKVVANQIEFFQTTYEAYGTRQTMMVTKKGSTKVTLTVLGDAASPAVRMILGALVLK